MIATEESDALLVDTLLLSCRVLGRGVEHTIIRRLGEIATARGLSYVNLPYLRTPRNEAARAFAEAMATFDSSWNFLSAASFSEAKREEKCQATIPASAPAAVSPTARYPVQVEADSSDIRLWCLELPLGCIVLIGAGVAIATIRARHRSYSYK